MVLEVDYEKHSKQMSKQLQIFTRSTNLSISIFCTTLGRKPEKSSTMHKKTPSIGTQTQRGELQEIKKF